ncbi:MAG: hypothetical protein LBT96_01950 [Campylobacteraceae bacterium]|jgi:hypothetical protein|nr:hypothetical protein [Campylobacteraceae bacterium]
MKKQYNAKMHTKRENTVKINDYIVSKRNRGNYIQGVSDILDNYKRFLVDSYDVFLVQTTNTACILQ